MRRAVPSASPTADSKGRCMTWIRRYAFGLIMLLALVLRVISLGTRTLWYDEAFAVLFSEKGLSAMLYGTLTPVAGGAADIHPLLYYTTLNGWMRLVGEGAFGVRFLSVIFGLATVGVVYLLARELFGKNTGLLAALITAIAPFHIQYSQEARMYSLMTLLLITATWCFVRAWRSGKESPHLPALADSLTGQGGEKDQAAFHPMSENRGMRILSAYKWWIAFGVLAGLAMYAQQLSAFYLAPLGLVPFIARKRQPIIGVLVGAAVALVVYLPWLVNLPGQLGKIASYYWVPQPTVPRLLGTARSFLVVSLDMPSPASVITLLIALFLSLFIAIQIVMFLRRPKARRPTQDAMLFALWLAGAPVLFMWLASQIRPVYLDRALLPSAAMLYVVLAWFFTSSGLPRPIAIMLGGIGLIVVPVGLYYQYTWNTFPNSPFDQAASYIQANDQPGDVVIHQAKLSALPMVYYDRALTQRYLADAPGSSEDTLALPTQQVLNLLADNCINSALKGAQRVWWVVFSEAEAQYATAGRPELTQETEWLHNHFSDAQTTSFGDLNVVLFSQPVGRAAAETGVCP
jgi:mannosyltransferase